MTQMTRKLVLFIVIVLGISSITALAFHILSVKGAILIEGHITSDTTWMPIDIYRVINNTYVDPGVTLSIKPGVQVHFEDNVSLIVEGSLNASGTESDPILFTSSRVADNPSDPYPGAWNTTRFNGNASEQFMLKNVKVEYAVHGVTIESSGVAIIEKSELKNCSESGIKLIGESNTIIRENVIVKNKNGITTDDAGTHAGITVNENEISNNTESGVYLYSYKYRADACLCNITFSSNDIRYNGQYGIYCRTYGVMPWTGYPSEPSSHIHNISISSNIIKANGRGGICLNTGFSGPEGSYGLCYIYDVSFSSNIITSNGRSGLYLYCDSMIGRRIYNVNLSSNLISSNNGDGVYLGYSKGIDSGYIYDVSFSSNTISSNNENGVSLIGLGSGGDSIIYNVAFSSNTVSGNSGNGLHFSSSSEDGQHRLYGYIYNVSLSSNTISENSKNGVYANATRHYGQLEFDLSVSNNTISANNETGAWIDGDINANFSVNTISNNLQGIYLYSSSNNTIIGNSITNNKYGIWLEYSSNNKIYHNNFVNNTQNVHIGTSSSAEILDNGYPLLTYIVIAIAIVAGAIGGLLVYFTKVRKKLRKPNNNRVGLGDVRLCSLLYSRLHF